MGIVCLFVKVREMVYPPVEKEKSRPDRNVRPIFLDEPDASGDTGIPVCAFFNRLPWPES